MGFNFELNFEQLLQIFLILVLIAQVRYLARQTNFFRRSSQANLKETWRKEFLQINFNSLDPEDPNALPDENEFEKLTNALFRMHLHFKEKLLKPSDFAIMFVLLFRATNYESLRKTVTYRENYLKLQEIFNDFNKDVDAIMYFFTLPTTSMYEEIFAKIPLFKKYKSLKKTLIGNWGNVMLGFRIKIWWDIHIKRIQTFELKPPISEK